MLVPCRCGGGVGGGIVITRELAADLVKYNGATSDGYPWAASLASSVVALHDEVERLNAEIAKLPATVDQTVNLLRLAEASVSLLRADLAATQERADVDAEALRMATLELRRLRAAEAPGTDDEAFEGTGWRSYPYPLDGATVRAWEHVKPGNRRGVCIIPTTDRWWVFIEQSVSARLALDAMRAAVPGSV